MDAQQVSAFWSFLDKGLVTGMFLFVFFMFIWKGIPALLALYERILANINTEQTKQITIINTEHTKQVTLLTDSFKEFMNKLSEENRRYNDENMRRHDETDKKLDSLISKKKRNA